MMSRLRLVIAWLMMAAIPMQGLAAATMAFCTGAHHQPTAQAKTKNSTAHRHEDGAVHDHGEAPVVEQEHKLSKAPSGAKSLPDASHKCGVCASCCYTVAIAQTVSLPAFIPLPQAELAEPFVLIHASPSPVPDKPPRA